MSFEISSPGAAAAGVAVAWSGPAVWAAAPGLACESARAAVSWVGNGSSTWDLKFQIVILRHVIFINKWVKLDTVMQIELAACSVYIYF